MSPFYSGYILHTKVIILLFICKLFSVNYKKYVPKTLFLKRARV